MTTPVSLWPLALIRESNDAAALFSRGLDALRAIRHDYTDAVAVMSLLALGAEKMLKLTIGLASRDQGAAWPSKDHMRRNIGHRVLKADQVARPLLDTHSGTAPGMLADLKQQVNHDPVVPQALRALDRFGDAGRFYFLDTLASANQLQDAPQTLWAEMTAAIAEGNSDLLADLASPDRYSHGRRQLNDTVTSALTRWWHLYATAWRTGAIGDEAKQYASELDLQTSARD
ncbi:hypothetical protein ACFPIJ_36350 [Dactylosporangium cerinum]|uniref:AbiV family abortive infection protein n=1 Tax=Dactylosporangium cerinum TaxID=1434730 RepID=A0ABV9W6F4_9ACTN